ncbi:MAG: LysR family transcriptional regulator [Gammaproteobacteria bacterium]|nr:LysR family transcriptional regulator [Gammaproteobacteria bacterium]
MKQDPATPLPPMNALRAFEAAARHLHFTRAAEELELQQSAVSRYIAELEDAIGARLFERRHRSVTLTAAGEILHRAVATGLERISAGALTVSDLADDRRIVIACGGATSELFLRPRLNALHQALGGNAVIRLLHCENAYLERPDVVYVDRIDLIASYHSVDGVPRGEAVVFPEAIAAVCSPGFAATHADTLRRPVAQWGALPFLSFARPSLGWAAWDDWFETVGRPQPPPRYLPYEDYVYLLDAAVAGQGLVLGWRNFMDRFLDTGSLVLAADGFVGFDRPLAIRLTERGSRRPAARHCLEAFGGLADRISDSTARFYPLRRARNRA